MIADASVGESELHQPMVRFKLTPEGQERFAAFTSVGVGRQLAVVFNGVVVAAPMIMAPITDGEGEIVSTFTDESAQNLAQSMRTPGPGVPLKIIKEEPGPGP